jgi:1-acyl-sn-glycerol-3-phosphate acyltransferase
VIGFSDPRARTIARSGTRIAGALAQVLELALAPQSNNDARARALRLQRVAAAMCRTHAFRVIRGGELPQGPCVLVANHRSYIDPIVIASLIACAPIAKQEVAEWPLIGTALEALGVLFVDRGLAVSGAALLRRAEQTLACGAPVLVFPEGTTGEGRVLQPFRRGMFEIAKKMRVPLIPIAIRYDSPRAHWIGDDLFLPHYFETASRKELRVFVDVGAELRASKEKKTEDLVAVVRGRIEELLRRAEGN